MNILAALLTLMLLAAVMAVVSRPLLVARAQEGTSRPEESGTPELSELEAEREAKYREIRDAELDYRTGKLSQEDYEAVNGTLRAEAVEILDKLESSQGDRFTESSQGDRFTESSQGDRFTESSQGDRFTESSQGDRLTEEGRAAKAAEEDQATHPAK
jgi:hypothetical protein